MKLTVQIIIFLFSINIFATSFSKMAENEFENLLGKDISYSVKKYKIPNKLRDKIQIKAKQKFYKKWLYFWQIKDSKNKKYYAFIDNVMGKQYPITFMIIFSKTGDIIFTKILKYRNKRGMELKKQSWLRQFLNKNSNSSFILNKDIDGISGATISSKALTKGFYKLSLLIAIINK